MLYAEGSRRYLEALSTYTRRRLTQATRAAVDSVEHVPAALALRQRPAIPGVRSTFGTSTELLNSLRLIFSRLGHHRCPHGHLMEPTIDVARDVPLTCPVCGVVFGPPSAESFAFNSEGACERCGGTGIVRDVDDTTLVPDESLTIDEGAVAPWGMFGLVANPKVVAEMGVRTTVPFAELTEQERKIVFAGPEEKRSILYPSKNGKLFDLNVTYRNAHQSVVEALKKAETEKGLGRIERFLNVHTCPACESTRLSARARARSTLVDGISLADATAKTLEDVTAWVRTLPALMPANMTAMADSIVTQIVETARMLLGLGLGYLTLDRASSTLLGTLSTHRLVSTQETPGQNNILTWGFICGAKGTRTPDPHTASVVRYQLRHSPVSIFCASGATPCAERKLHHCARRQQIAWSAGERWEAPCRGLPPRCYPDSSAIQFSLPRASMTVPL